MMPFTQKQKSFAAHGKGALVCAFGAVRSGKTYSGLFGFLLHTQTHQPDKLHLITGRNKGVIDRELVRNLEEFSALFKLPVRFKIALGHLKIGSVEYYVSAGYDVKSEARIRGLSIGSVFFDEATLCPQEYWEQTIARMTFEDSKLWATCNPSNTAHWLKRQWIDKGKFCKVLHLGFDDNPSLTQTVKDRNQELFTGVFAKRMVDGQWTDSTGLIYPEYYPAEEYNENNVAHTDIGIDYGTAGTTTFVAIDYLKHSNRAVVRDVWYWNAPERGKQLTDLDVCEKLKAFMEQNQVKRGAIYCDPSAASLILQIRKTPGIGHYVRESDNDVLSGLRVVGASLATKRLTFSQSPGLEPLIEEIAAYRWDEDKDDEPIKDFDHACDALRYAYYTRNKFDYGGSISRPHGY